MTVMKGATQSTSPGTGLGGIQFSNTLKTETPFFYIYIIHYEEKCFNRFSFQ